MKIKRIIWAAIILLGLSAAAYFYFSKPKGETIRWKMAEVERGNIDITIMATGSINALTTLQVGTQVSGTIAKLYADFNSKVKGGQIIALLDTTFLAASKSDAEATMRKATVQLKQMNTEFQRIKKLYESNVVAQSDYELASTNYESAQATLLSAEAQWKRAKINLAYATIKAPISGVVISRNVDVGQTVVSSFNTPTLFTIANDLTKMQVYANVDETDIGQVKVDQHVSFTVDAYPNEKFVGKVKQIRLQPTVIQNVVNYTVIIDVPNPQLKLMPGMTANITFKVDEHNNILRVPTNALRFVPPSSYYDLLPLPDSVKQHWKGNQVANIVTGTSAYIWLKDGNELVPKRVMIGLMEGGYAEVSGDVKEGDVIILGINKDESNGAKNPFMPSFRTQPRRS